MGKLFEKLMEDAVVNPVSITKKRRLEIHAAYCEYIDEVIREIHDMTDDNAKHYSSAFKIDIDKCWSPQDFQVLGDKWSALDEVEDADDEILKELVKT